MRRCRKSIRNKQKIFYKKRKRLSQTLGTGCGVEIASLPRRGMRIRITHEAKDKVSMEEDFKSLLKPCPYCGGEPIWFGHFDIVCQRCGLAKGRSVQAARVRGITALATAVIWNNLGNTGKRQAPFCPVCGSCEVECWAERLKNEKYTYSCYCKNCKTYGPWENTTPFQSLKTFQQIRVPEYAAILKSSLVSVVVESGRRALSFCVNSSIIWSDLAIEQAAKSGFWTKAFLGEPVRVYRNHVMDLVLRKSFNKWPKWSEKDFGPDN